MNVLALDLITQHLGIRIAVVEIERPTQTSLFDLPQELWPFGFEQIPTSLPSGPTKTIRPFQEIGLWQRRPRRIAIAVN